MCSHTSAEQLCSMAESARKTEAPNTDMAPPHCDAANTCGLVVAEALHAEGDVPFAITKHTLVTSKRDGTLESTVCSA